MSDIAEHLQAILDTLPTKPGCYLYKNSAGEIIYVGKAINLRNRVRSYFHASADLDGKTRQLVRNIAHIEWIVVASELEALTGRCEMARESDRPARKLKSPFLGVGAGRWEESRPAGNQTGSITVSLIWLTGRWPATGSAIQPCLRSNGQLHRCANRVSNRQCKPAVKPPGNG